MLSVTITGGRVNGPLAERHLTFLCDDPTACKSRRLNKPDESTPQTTKEWSEWLKEIQVHQQVQKKIESKKFGAAGNVCGCCGGRASNASRKKLKRSVKRSVKNFIQRSLRMQETP